MCFSPGPTMALLSLKLTARRKPKGCRARPACSTASGNHSQILHHPTLRTTSKFRTGELFRSLPASKAKGFDFVTLRDMLISCLWKFAGDIPFTYHSAYLTYGYLWYLSETIAVPCRGAGVFLGIRGANVTATSLVVPYLGSTGKMWCFTSISPFNPSSIPQKWWKDVV